MEILYSLLLDCYRISNKFYHSPFIYSWSSLSSRNQFSYPDQYFYGTKGNIIGIKNALYSWLQYYANFIQNFILLNIAQRDVCYTYGLFQHQNDVCAFEKNDETLCFALSLQSISSFYDHEKKNDSQISREGQQKVDQVCE